LRKVANFISGAEIGSLAKSTIYPTFSLKLYCQSTDLAGVELAAQFGLSGRPLVIVNEGDLMLRDSLGHEQALDFMVDGEPRPALVFSLDDRVGRDGWVIRRFCYLGRSRHNGFAVAIGFDSIIASRETLWIP
jgi:hypothetical protein